jgi:diguanylate cyclase (GGDEF)-like protein
MVPSIKIDIFFILPLVFTILLARRHVKINKNYTLFMIASMLTITLLVLDIASILVLQSDGNKAVILNKIVNLLGFSLGPLVPYVMFLFINSAKKENHFHLIFALPLIINALLSTLSMYTGWLFQVDIHNIYSRGPLFLLNPFICLFYFFMDIYTSIQNKHQGQTETSFSLILIYALPFVAVALQYFFPEVLVIWGSISLVLLMYYVDTLEQYFSFDALTGINNRESFEVRMQAYRNRHSEDTTIFVFDLNNLKRANDTLGHIKGDEMLSAVATILTSCFKKIGQTYRIGGDEFCVLAKAMNEKEANSLLEQVQASLDFRNKGNSSVPLILAYGFATCSKTIAIDEAFAKADNQMYAHKALIKQKKQ